MLRSNHAGLNRNPDKIGRDSRYRDWMAVNVRIPTTMRPLTGGQKLVELDAGSLSNVITALEGKHPGMGERLLDDDGALRKFVNIFVDDDDVRYLDGLDTKVADGWTVSIIPAVAGG